MGTPLPAQEAFRRHTRGMAGTADTPRLIAAVTTATVVAAARTAAAAVANCELSVWQAGTQAGAAGAAHPASGQLLDLHFNSTAVLDLARSQTAPTTTEFKGFTGSLQFLRPG